MVGMKTPTTPKPLAQTRRAAKWQKMPISALAAWLDDTANGGSDEAFVVLAVHAEKLSARTGARLAEMADIQKTERLAYWSRACAV